MKYNWKKIGANPFWLTGVFTALMLVILGMAYLFDGTLFTLKSQFPFLLASFISFVMAVFVALITLSSDNVDKHMSRSILAYLLTVVMTGVIAFVLSSREDFEGFGKIYLVISFCFLVIISILSAIRRMVIYAENEEWNAPRKKQKKQL